MAHTPITLEHEGTVLAIHEAALLEYPSMTLKNINDNQITFTADLVPWANGDKAYINTPFTSPWRVIQAGKIYGYLVGDAYWRKRLVAG